MVNVADWSWQRPTARQVRDAGYQGAIRYLSYEPSKNLGAAERDALWAEGISIGLVWESTARGPMGGRVTGQEHGREANVQANAHRWPARKVLIYAVDFDATAAELPVIADYFRGVGDVGGRPAGAYGPDHVLDYLASTVGHLVHCHWQAAAWSGVGRGSGGSVWVPDYARDIQLSAHACLFQFFGSLRLAGTDHNESTPHAAGDLDDLLYHPDQPSPVEDDVPLSDDDLNKIRVAVREESRPRVIDHNGGQQIVLATPDGFVGVPIPGNAVELLRWANVTGPHSTITDSTAPQLTAQLQALARPPVERLEGTVRAATAAVLAAIDADPDVPSPELPASFVTDVAAAVIAKLGPAVAAAVDSELDHIAD